MEIIDFLLNPTTYSVPLIDSWLGKWATAVDQFIVANPYSSATIAAGVVWFIKRTPWEWDDKMLEWVKKKFA